LSSDYKGSHEINLDKKNTSKTKGLEEKILEVKEKILKETEILKKKCIEEKIDEKI